MFEKAHLYRFMDDKLQQQNQSKNCPFNCTDKQQK